MTLSPTAITKILGTSNRTLDVLKLNRGEDTLRIGSPTNHFDPVRGHVLQHHRVFVEGIISFFSLNHFEWFIEFRKCRAASIEVVENARRGIGRAADIVTPLLQLQNVNVVPINNPKLSFILEGKLN